MPAQVLEERLKEEFGTRDRVAPPYSIQSGATRKSVKAGYDELYYSNEITANQILNYAVVSTTFLDSVLQLQNKGDLLTHTGTARSRLVVGANYTFLMALSTETLGLKYLPLTTTKGDILGHDGTQPTRHAVGSDGKVVTAKASETNGIEWAYASAFPGDIIFGDGLDGSITLVANTAIVNSTLTIQFLYYTTVDISTFTWTGSDRTVNLFIKTSLAGNGGTITLPAVTGGGVGGTAGSGGAGGGGSGGQAGQPVGMHRVFARVITGTGTIQANGDNGNNGSNAGVATSIGNGASGSSQTAGYVFRGVSLTGNAATVPTGGTSAGAGGNGGSAPTKATDYHLAVARDPLNIFITTMDGLNFVTNAAHWEHQSAPADGAAAGGRNNGGAQGAGGGGSAGSSGAYFNDGVAGVAGGNGGAGGSGAGGGAGGAASPGALLIIASRNIAAGWTFRSKGGTGGNGGAGNGYGGGGAGGSGGSGGWLRIAAGYGSGAFSTDVAGGPGGTGGAPGGSGGSAGTDGNTGPNGYAEVYVL